MPSQELLRYAVAKGIPKDELRRVYDDFRDYWIAKPGAGGRKLDWEATWRTWVRREADRREDRARRNGETVGRPERIGDWELQYGIGFSFYRNRKTGESWEHEGLPPAPGEQAAMPW